MTLKNRIEDVEKAFDALRQEYIQKKISDKEFRERLKELRVEDQQGRCWTIGARTGNWYYFDGKNWIESQPPTLQEKKVICIQCGCENDLESETCKLCGSGVAESEEPFDKDVLPIITPSEELPLFAVKQADESEQVSESVQLEDYEPEFETRAIPEIKEEKTALSVIHSVDVLSFGLFWGILGLFAGIILGVLAGTTEYFSSLNAGLPGFLQAVRGQLLRGLVFGLLGAGSGFVISAGFGALEALLINVILYFTGGLKFSLRSNETQSKE